MISFSSSHQGAGEASTNEKGSTAGQHGPTVKVLSVPGPNEGVFPDHSYSLFLLLMLYL